MHKFKIPVLLIVAMILIVASSTSLNAWPGSNNDELKKALEDKETELATAESNLTEKENELNSINEKLADKETELNSINTKLADKETELTNLANEFNHYKKVRNVIDIILGVALALSVATIVIYLITNEL